MYEHLIDGQYDRNPQNCRQNITITLFRGMLSLLRRHSRVLPRIPYSMTLRNAISSSLCVNFSRLAVLRRLCETLINENFFLGVSKCQVTYRTPTFNCAHYENSHTLYAPRVAVICASMFCLDTSSASRAP